MSTAVTATPDVVLPPTNLPSEDGVPLETDWHRVAMNLLIDLVIQFMGDREDYYVGGNMFIYFDAKQARGRNFRGPDFFFVRDVPREPMRPYWAVWDEAGRYPDVIVELTSPSTALDDHGIKKKTYERTFHTSEYFIYDPEEDTLEGWRLGAGTRYQPIKPDARGWMWSEQLGMWIGRWQGTHVNRDNVWLRFFEKDGAMVPTAAERAAAAQERILAEKRRADAAEAELRRLRSKRNKT